LQNTTPEKSPEHVNDEKQSSTEAKETNSEPTETKVQDIS